jgi:hypothetical protein
MQSEAEFPEMRRIIIKATEKKNSWKSPSNTTRLPSNKEELDEARFYAPPSTDCQTLMVGDLFQWRQTLRRRKKPHKTKPETEREFPVEVYTERDLREREREREKFTELSVSQMFLISHQPQQK